MNSSDKKSVLIIVLLLLGLSVLLYESTINLFPSFIHAWTQSDRYAIALRFLDNGFDFFHPATFNLQTIEGITRVDFPINEFIVAISMKFFGSTAPFFFRVYTLSISIIGLAYLYLFAKKITSSEIKSGLVVLFVFFSPVYFYYQIGFLPSIPAISCTFAGYYYFFSYKESEQKKHFLFAIAFFLLAALMRFPFVIFLVAILLQQVFMALKDKKIKRIEVISFSSAFIVFVGYYLYNVHLGRIYGNMFLDFLLPAKNFSELKEIISEMIHHWGLHYFTFSHYALLFVSISATAILFLKRSSLLVEEKRQWFQLLIVFCGTGLYFLLMARQYFAHDYYFLDSFFVPVVLLLVFSVNSIKMETTFLKFLWTGIFVIQVVLFYVFSQKIQAERYYSGPWDRTEITRQNFIGTETYLDGRGISKDAKILVIDAYTTNVPLILMNRKGYTVLGTTAKNISTSLFWSDWDYVAIQDIYLVSDVIKSYPIITSMLERIGGNGKVSFYKKSDKMRLKSLKSFLGISKETTFFNSGKTDSISFKFNPDIEYGLTISIKAAELKNEKDLKALVVSDFEGDQLLDKLQVVAAITNKDKTVYYQNFFLSDYFKQSIGKQKMEFQFVLPAFETPDDELKIYLWNPGKINFEHSNWEVIVYK